MKLVKVGRKWKIEGDGEGWIFGRTFPANIRQRWLPLSLSLKTGAGLRITGRSAGNK